MNQSLIGRQEEQKILADALHSQEAEMVAVIGRRRVGKTFLIQSVYEEQIVFEITGTQHQNKSIQLRNFKDVLMEYSHSQLPLGIPADWTEAFQMLKQYLKPLLGREKKVLFFDELPWLASNRSGFLEAFGYFWNSWAVRQHLVLVICGSAASWMIRRVVNHRGGLYNRISKRIFLAPFSLAETEAYLQSRNIIFNRYQLTQLYMAMGGIPHYLKEIKGGRSAVQNINQICFGKNGLLKTEFLRLYPSLFANADQHFAVIRSLAKSRKGLTQGEISKASKVPIGGSLSRVLEELDHSGFISAYHPFGRKKKDKVYRLTDEYSLFYLMFIEGLEEEGPDTWNHLSQTQRYKSWCGYAFESLCLKHIPQIKQALGISGVYSVSSFFYKQGTKQETGTQIDLLIERKDQVINLFEIKFHNKPFVITKAYADNLRNKKWIFQEHTQSRKQIFLSMISTFGIKPNEHSLGLVEQVIELDALFSFTKV